MASVKAWYWTALGILVLTVGTSDTVRCWAGKGAEALDQLYSRGRAYVAVAHILLGNPAANDARLQDQRAQAQAARDRFRAQEAMAQARLDRAQALVEERAIRQQELLMRKAMRADRAVQAMQVRGDRIVIPGRVFVGPEGVIVNGQHRVEICPSQVEVDAPNIQLPDLPSLQVMPEAPRDPI